MEILYLNKNNFDETVFAENRTALVVFYAQWCPPCQALSVVLEKFSKEVENLTIAKVNIDSEAELANTYSVYSVPTLMLVKNGEVIKTEPGFKSKEALKKFIEN